ncbi:MAG: Asp-tRNA(Asn)/Glu-tRNA(Gln) amidotransferase subunit GatC [Pelagibacterales bacterium]|nr:Asp-tRNA(Asn)/Glu-tRNA(Gln) amidotransferase subunit GatC [Pelagibacterales bacterium]
MSVTANDIKKVAKLARIEIPEELREKTASQVEGIINWVAKLDEVNTDFVEPLTNPNESSLRMVKDEISDGNIAQDVLENAKNSKYDYFTVPKVIE